ncbi:MAG: hypothetical protein BWY89_01216 [Bacteroidetes bacterium ADurb.BinA012]|nr:MAG: hypothetical protein BWY89_01216 [Bacteroidetes bacterium ADurb.BinA012]
MHYKFTSKMVVHFTPEKVVQFGRNNQLILKAGYLVDKLRLSKGFDEERIDLGNLDSIEIIKISLMIIGGLLFINNIPTFLTYLVYSFKAEQIGITSNNDYLFKLGVSAINIIIGYLIFTNSAFLSKHLNKEK